MDLQKLTKIEPFAVGFLTADREDRCYKIAYALKFMAENLELKMDLKNWFQAPVKSFVPYSIGFSRADGICVRDHENGVITRENIKTKKIALYPEYEEELNELYDVMRPYDLWLYLNSITSDIEKKLDENKCCWGRGGGHGNPDFYMLLRLGTKGMREKIEKFRFIHNDRDDFYDALLLCCDAIEIFAKRFQEKAKELIKTAEGEDKVVLERLIEAFDNIPENSPRNFFEAAQYFWMAYGIADFDSPGLFDYFLGPWYQNDPDKELRYKCLEKLWQLFYETRSWNLCVGGSDEFGNDMSNDLTYDTLKVAREFKYNTPNITMRVHKNTPDSLWHAAVDTLATGIGMPAIYNDECVCTALESIGIPPSDSHLYCMNGCNQIDIFGKSHMGLEDGEISIIKAVEFALFNGVCKFSNEKLGLTTGDAREFKSFEEFMAAYYKQVEYLADTIVSVSNRYQEAYAKYAPIPWRSLTIQGCIERGLEYKNKGPYYGHGQVLTEGLPDAADSMAAIKHYIYDTKKYTMAELLDALDKDFEGYDELYKDFKGYDKFGNDIDEVDDIYAAISDHIYRYFRTKKTFRGGVFGVGCSTYHRAPNYAIHCGALPNGKKNNETLLADSIGCTPGNDKCGPTALLNSVLRGNQYLSTSGNVMQMKFNKAQFNTDAGKQAYIALAKTYFRMGGQTLQINVVSREELLDAKVHPEKYENLIVRVGGFSEYFNRLPEPLQDNIIARTDNEI